MNKLDKMIEKDNSHKIYDILCQSQFDNLKWKVLPVENIKNKHSKQKKSSGIIILQKKCLLDECDRRAME